MSVDISRALMIERGSSVEDLEWLAEAVKNCQRILELGTLQGRSTRAMLDNSKAHVWCVDTWKGSATGTASEVDFEAFLENIQDVRDRVTILKMSTCEAIGFLPDGCFDAVYIDADHCYQAVRFDIMNYAPLLCKSGLLCGHDVGWKGVDKAVKELIARPRKGGNAIWWAIKEAGWLL